MDKKWVGTTYGNGWMHKHLIRFLRFIDVRVFYVFTYVFIIPFVLLLNPSRGTAFRYFRLRLGYGYLRSVWKTYVNHCRFAEVVIDRFAMYAGRKFEVVVPDMDRFNALAAKPEGFVMMSSHIGNYEIAGYCLVSREKSINAVVYEYEKESVMKNRGTMFGKTNVNMIAMKQDLSHLFEIDSALGSGNIVSFPTDRSMGGRVIDCDFLGAPAEFPMGPFSVATMRGLDVLAVNVMKTGWLKYTIYVTPLQYDRTAGRKEQMSRLSAAYVAELEKRVRQYPTQWYNFFEFWR